MVLALPVAPESASGQELPRPFPEPQDSVAVEEGVSPGGAFLRAIALPGWGHAAIGSHGRGGFYLASQAGTAWMLFRTRSRIRDAERVLELREGLVRQRLVEQGVAPEAIEGLVESDEGVADARSLVAARDQQFEDWTALGIFVILLSGADAFVSAHLQAFPGPVELGGGTRPDGAVELKVSVPLPAGR